MQTHVDALACAPSSSTRSPLVTSVVSVARAMPTKRKANPSAQATKKPRSHPQTAAAGARAADPSETARLELAAVLGRNVDASRIRKTSGEPARVSVYDVFQQVFGIGAHNTSRTFTRMLQEFPELREEVNPLWVNFPFPGQGQRETPVADARSPPVRGGLPRDACRS